MGIFVFACGQAWNLNSIYLVYVLFSLYMFFMEGTSEWFLWCLTVPFNIILFFLAIQHILFILTSGTFLFIAHLYTFLSGVFTLAWLYSLIFLLHLWSRYFIPYRCLFPTFYFLSPLDHVFCHSIFTARWKTFIYLSTLSISFLCLPYIDFSHLLLRNQLILHQPFLLFCLLWVQTQT